MKNFPLFLTTLFVALFLTACNKEDNFPKALQVKQQVDQTRLLEALLAPEVAANAGQKVDGVLQMQLNGNALEEDLQQAIKNGALEELEQITISSEQAEMIFNTTDLASIVDTENTVAKDRGCQEICYSKEICILNTGECYYIEHCIVFCY